MKYALNLADNGRILSATFAKYAPADSDLVDELPEGDISDYLYKNGEYVYDPLPEPEPAAPEPTPINDDEMAAAILEGVNDV